MKFYEMRPFVRNVSLKRYAVGRNESMRAMDSRLFYVMSGAGCMHLEGVSDRFKHGSVLLIAPDVRYSIEAIGDVATVLEIEFDYNCAYADQKNALPIAVKDEALEGEAHVQPEFEDVVSLNEPLFVEDAGEIEGVLNAMMLDYQRKKPHWRVRLGAQFISAISCICEERDELTDRVIELVEKRYMEPLANGDIASELGYHPNYANAVFRKKMGMTIHQYLLRYRIDAAMQLIQTTDLPISQIAEKTGFRYFSHFSQCFRHVTGHSPGDYRVHHTGS